MMLDPLDGRGPLYRQLYCALRRAILSGRVPAGSRLPSTRWMAGETGVARNRVVLAYTQLLDEGYVVGRVGAGTYVASELPGDERAAAAPARLPAATRPPRLTRSARTLMARGPGWIATSPELRYDFACGRPSFRDFPQSVWARLVRRRVRVTRAADLDYAPAAGIPELRSAIADHLTRWRGVVCTAEQVIVTSGSQQALGIIAGLLLEPGDCVALEEPHYAGARQAFQAARATVVPVRVDAQGIDVERLAGSRCRMRLAYVTPAHQFPTGVVLPLARRLALLDWARRTGGYVVEDDYDSEYRYAGAPIESLQGIDRDGRVFYVGSFSKILSPALRLGYLVVPTALVRAVTMGKMAADLGSASFEQRVLAEFITAGHFAVHLRRSRRRQAARRVVLLEAITEHLGRGVQVVGGEAGLHVMVVPRRSASADVARLVRRAAERDVGVYSTLALHLRRPRTAALLIGHGSLSEAEIRVGMSRLGAAMQL
jgi:GntR family transcriptional regulator / MocR family aminotransferase